MQLDPDIFQERARWIQSNSFLASLMESLGMSLTPERMPSSWVGTPSEDLLIESLLASLDRAPDAKAQQSYVSTLLQTSRPYSPARLIELFDETDSLQLQFEIIRAMSQSGAENGTEWLKRIIMDATKDIRLRSVAAAGAANTKTPKEFLPLMRKYYVEFPYSALHTFYKVGEKEDIQFLEEHVGKLYSLPANVQKEYSELLEKTLVKLRRKYK